MRSAIHTKKLGYAGLLLAALLLQACKPAQKAGTKSSTSASKDKGLSEQEQVKFGALFVDACRERMKGNVEVAENIFRECLKIDGSSSAVKYELGNIYRFSGMYDNALKYGRECANEDVKNEWYQLLYIECLHNKRQYAAAAEIYSRLIKNYPERADFYEGLAAEYMYAGSYDKSYKVYDDIEKRFGASDVFTLNKIKLLKQQKKTAEAEAELKKLVQANPENARYYTYLAEFYQETNQNDKAIDTYQQILKVDPNNPMVHLALADYYKQQNNKDKFNAEVKTAFENPDLDIDTKLKILISYYEYTEQYPEYIPQAYELCQIIIKTHPSAPESHSIYADFLYRDKKIPEACIEYSKAARLDKSRFKVWNKVMYIQSELSQYDSLAAYSAEAIELFPNQANPYFFNGVANIQLKNYQKAVDALRDGLEFVYDDKPLLIQFYANLGDAYNYLQNYEKSDKAFDDALKVDPDNTYILNNYAYFLSLRKQNLEKAEKFSKRSNELTPNNRSYIDTYGWILYQLGKYKEAEEWLGRATRIGNKNAVILEHYADVLYQLNRKDEALTYWKEAKAAGQGSEWLDKKIADKKLYE